MEIWSTQKVMWGQRQTTGMRPQAQGRLEPQRREEAGGTLPRASGGSLTCQRLDHGLPGPMSVRKEIPVVLSHQVCGTLSAATGNQNRFWYKKMECYSNKYLKMWKWFWNWIIGRGWKNFKKQWKKSLDHLEETIEETRWLKVILVIAQRKWGAQ